MVDIPRFPQSSGPKISGEMSASVIARIVRRVGFVRLHVVLKAETAERLDEAAAWAGKSPDEFVADMVTAAFPVGPGGPRE